MVRKNWSSFSANIKISESTIKSCGFGRSEYEAIKTAIFNLVEQLLLDEKFLNPIKESLKVFVKPTTKIEIPEEKIINNNEIFTNSVSLGNFHIVKSESFVITGKNNFLETWIEIVKEKNLIILELEKLILDIMNYNKVN